MLVGVVESTLRAIRARSKTVISFSLAIETWLILSLYIRISCLIVKALIVSTSIRELITQLVLFLRPEDSEQLSPSSILSWFLLALKIHHIPTWWVQSLSIDPWICEVCNVVIYVGETSDILSLVQVLTQLLRVWLGAIPIL